LASRRLAQLDLVSLGINDPGKLPILGVVNLVEHIAAFFLQGLHKREDIFHSVVDHERSSAPRKLLLACGAVSQAVVPATGLPSASVQSKEAPPQDWTSISKCRLYQACSDGASLALKKIPPMPVTRFMRSPMRGGSEPIVAENKQFHKFSIITMILKFSHDSVIRWEDVLGLLSGDSLAR
jgi:hypothetical protein